MGGPLDLYHAAKRERLRTFNPEIPPDAMWGDVGFVVPALDELDRDMVSWGWRMARIAAAIAASFAAAIVVLIVALWLLGAF